MISILAEFVHDWAQRCLGRDRVIQRQNRCDFRPASADILPNRKNKTHSSRQPWGAGASCNESIRRKIGMRQSASFLASRTRKQGTQARIQEELRSYPRFSCGQRKDNPRPQSLWLAFRCSLYQDQTKCWRFSCRNLLSRPLPPALFLVFFLL